jgi:cytochrome b6-f complex iron-sulfur subunit
VVATVLNGTAVLTIDAASPLAPVGGMALVRSSTGEFLVTRVSQDSCTAVTAVCTHEACTVTGFEGQTFVCPCHGSQYNTNGSVVRGPATQPLRQYPTQFAGGVLMISV